MCLTANVRNSLWHCIPSYHQYIYVYMYLTLNNLQRIDGTLEVHRFILAREQSLREMNNRTTLVSLLGFFMGNVVGKMHQSFPEIAAFPFTDFWYFLRSDFQGTWNLLHVEELLWGNFWYYIESFLLSRPLFSCYSSLFYCLSLRCCYVHYSLQLFFGVGSHR